MYDPFIFANNSFSKILSINCDRDGVMSQSCVRMTKSFLRTLKLSGINFFAYTETKRIDFHLY